MRVTRSTEKASTESVSYTLFDSTTRKSAQLSFGQKDPILLVPDGAGFRGWYNIVLIPQSDAQSLIICEPHLMRPEERQDRRAFERVDLGRASGRSWIVTFADLRTMVGDDAVGFTLIKGISPAIGRVLACVRTCKNDMGCHWKLLSVDAAHGSLINACTLPDSVTLSTGFAASTDGQYLAFADATNLHRPRLTIVSTQSGKVLHGVDFVSHGWPTLLSCDDRFTALVQTPSQIWEVPISGAQTPSCIFDLLQSKEASLPTTPSEASDKDK
jgi:hypothetical protein